MSRLLSNHLSEQAVNLENAANRAELGPAFLINTDFKAQRCPSSPPFTQRSQQKRQTVR